MFLVETKSGALKDEYAIGLELGEAPMSAAIARPVSEFKGRKETSNKINTHKENQPFLGGNVKNEFLHLELSIILIKINARSFFGGHLRSGETDFSA
ncbi:MAG: hypothetical protein AAB824_02625 [Patescibacteria group bacterium]